MIHIKHLYKHFGDKKVLDDLSLEVKTGETLVILGRSGTGKSVLLKQILGIQKPDKGKIFLDQLCLTDLNENALYKAVLQMGMLFQGGALFDSLTVGENTAFYLSAHSSFTKKEIATLVAEALEMVGLSGTEHLMPSDLSGGMRKRAALARLIVYRPKVLLYDEPTTGLDPITSMQINDLIIKIQEELGATSLVVTHDICSAFHVADRLALIHQGKIAQLAPKEEFKQINDPLIQTFLQNAVVS